VSQTALEVEQTNFWLLSDDGSELTCPTRVNRKSNAISTVLKTAGFPRYIKTLMSENLICTEDAQNDRRTSELTLPYLKSQKIVSLMAAGIFIEGKLMGAVCSEHKGEIRKWHSDEEVFFSTVAGIISQIFLYEDRKKTQEALKSSELRFKEILKNVPSVAVQGYSEEGTVCYWNHASTKFYGYTEEEAMGNSLLDLIIPPDKKDVVLHEIRTMTEMGKPIPPSELTLMRKDGSPITVYSSHSYVNIPGKVPEFFCIDIDLSERKQAEMQMRFLSAITENMNDSIIVTDTKGKIAYINKGAQKLYGYTLDELTGNSPDLFNIDPRADEIQKELYLTLAKGEIYHGEALNRRKDGSEFICDITVAPLTDERSNLSSYIGLQRDITENKNIEKVVIRQERLSAIGELASGVAHDFNNVLQIILGGVEMALVADEPEELNQYLESIKKSASDAASRVRQLQRFAQKSQSQKETTSININELSEDVINEVKLLLNQYQEKGIHIALLSDYQARENIEGNEGELRACLVNLVKNSAEAMPEGGSITISTCDYNGQVRVSIADTGTGMDRETQKKIFQPFYSTKGFEPGRGLGMAQVYSIIRDHRGKIYIKKSETGKGTVMEFTLPISHKKVVFEKNTVSASGTARILWVDDEEMIRHLGKSMLKILGHDADVAGSGEEALAYLARGNHYDLIITDVGMPGMSGWQLAEQIKNKGYPVKIALLTGWGTEVSQEERERYNVSYVLGKPLPMKELKVLISEVI
jgi:two-component system cell cycle sensor histidine kinase/response regulator CckA